MKSIEELMALRDAAKAKMTTRDDSTALTRVSPGPIENRGAAAPDPSGK